jgi:ABC-type nickel/cobalt efflux system permease component RcnA
MNPNAKGGAAVLDTCKVMLATMVNFSALVEGLEIGLRIIISLLTIWYLWRKCHPRKREADAREDAIEELD